MALNWDFVRQVDTNSKPGNTTSYYQTACQRLYLKDGKIKTDIGVVENGQWQNVETGEVALLSVDGYTLLDVEHYFNGKLFAVAIKNGAIVFLMHQYQT